MVQPTPGSWENLQRARDKLVEQYLRHPDVTLIDIGYRDVGSHETSDVVLRIHVRERWMKTPKEERIPFPEEVDGVPVIIVVGEYRLEE